MRSYRSGQRADLTHDSLHVLGRHTYTCCVVLKVRWGEGDKRTNDNITIMKEVCEVKEIEMSS